MFILIITKMGNQPSHLSEDIPRRNAHCRGNELNCIFQKQKERRKLEGYLHQDRMTNRPSYEYAKRLYEEDKRLEDDIHHLTNRLKKIEPMDVRR